MDIFLVRCGKVWVFGRLGYLRVYLRVIGSSGSVYGSGEALVIIGSHRVGYLLCSGQVVFGVEISWSLLRFLQKLYLQISGRDRYGTGYGKNCRHDLSWVKLGCEVLSGICQLRNEWCEVGAIYVWGNNFFWRSSFRLEHRQLGLSTSTTTKS